MPFVRFSGRLFLELTQRTDCAAQQFVLNRYHLLGSLIGPGYIHHLGHQQCRVHIGHLEIKLLDSARLGPGRRTGGFKRVGQVTEQFRCPGLQRSQ